MDVDGWKTINRLVGEALSLPPSERTTWLERLDAEYEAFKPRLRAMLDEASGDDPAAFLATLPRFDPPEAAAPDDWAGGATPGAAVGPYRLVRQLASGGQGAVWLAERADGLLERPVALKLPLGLAYRPALAERLARERRILARLEHPNIARLYDAGVTATGTPYLALEYVEGAHIDQHVRARNLDVRATLRLFLQVTRAVAYAHSLLVVHRDLKPSNILVSPDGQARLLDFGIAGLLDTDGPVDSTITQEDGRALTLAYASPEQVSHQTLGTATDVFSLGVVLFELLTGRRPHQPARNTRGALEDAILDGTLLRASEAAADAPRRAALRGDLDAVLLKALRKAPGERYASATAFADDVARYLDGLPVEAQPDSAAYRTRKFVARHRVAVAAGTVALAAVLAGAGVAAWQARVANAALARAESVTAFLTSMFRDIDPNVRGQGRAFTASDVLGMAQARLDTEAALAPDTRAELLRILGQGFMGAGDPTRAVETLGAAIDATTAVDGADADTTLDLRLRRATARMLASQDPAAVDENLAVTTRLRESGRGETPLFAEAVVARLELLLNSGKAATPDAETAAIEALEAVARIGGLSGRLVSRAHRGAAVVARTRNRHAEALDHAETGYRVLLDDLAGDTAHPQAVLARNEYGRALFQVGRGAEAVVELRGAAETGARTFAGNPMIQQHLLGTLANIELVSGAVKDAVRHLDEAMALDLTGVTLSPTYLASQHIVRGRARAAARQWSEAIGSYDEALAVYRQTSDRSQLATLESERAEALLRAGRVGDARPVLEQLVAGRGTSLAPATRRALWLLAEDARRQGRLDEARRLLTEAIAGEVTSTRSRSDRGQFQVSLALTLTAAGEARQALPLLDQAATALAPVAGGAPTPAYVDVLSARARAYLALGDRAAALPPADEANRFWRAFAPASPDAQDAARLYIQAGGSRP